MCATPVQTLHTAGKLSGLQDAIGGYTYNIIAGLKELEVPIAAAMLPYRQDPEQARRELLAQCDTIFHHKEMLPILHIQLTHPLCGNPFDAEFIRNFPYPVVVTCQELKRMVRYQESSQVVLQEIIEILRAADKIIFIDTNEQKLAQELELKYHNQNSIYGKSAIIDVIPAGVQPTYPGAKEKNQDIIYFGIFRQDKGLDRIAKFAQSFRDDSENIAQKRKMYLIGYIPEQFKSQRPYLDRTILATHNVDTRKMSVPEIIALLQKEQYKDHPIQYRFNVEAEAISELMTTQGFALFLFPDGATKYGSSIPTALAHGLVPLLTDGPDIAAAFTQHQAFGKEIAEAYTDGAATVLKDTPSVATEAYTAYKDLLKNPELAERLRTAGLKYATRLTPKKCAAAHAVAYSSLSEHPKIQKLPQTSGMKP